jgi:hypothetical protein
MDNRINGVLFSRGVGDFSLLHIDQTSFRSRLASHPMDTGGSMTRIKRPGHETNKSPASNGKDNTA